MARSPFPCMDHVLTAALREVEHERLALDECVCGWEKVLDGEEGPSSWPGLRSLPHQEETSRVHLLGYPKEGPEEGI